MAFPQDLLGIKVELFYDGVWNALPPGSVRGLGAEDGEITIGLRGQPDESSGIVTTLAQLSINNQNGTYSPRNMSSPLYGKIGANTPIRISADVDSLIGLVDPFGTPGTNGWPTGPQGYAYTTLGGSTADYSVAGGLALHDHAAVNTEHVSTVTNQLSTDHEMLITGVQMEALPTGAGVEVCFRSRESGTDFVQTRLVFKTDNTVEMDFDYAWGGGTNFNVVTILVPGVTATDAVNVRVQMNDDVHRARAWKTGTTEPSFWNTAVAGLNLPTGGMSVRSRLPVGVSNVLPFTVSFQALEVQFGIVLYYGEVSEWPKKWDSTGTDVWVSIEASGITRRLVQNAKPLRSPLYRYMKKRDLTAYWSFENLQGASDAYTSFASDLDGGYPLVYGDAFGISGGGAYNSVNAWGSETTLLGGDALPTISRGQAGGNLSMSTARILPTDITDDAFSVSFWDFGLLNTDTTSVFQSFIVVLYMANAVPITQWNITVGHNILAGPIYETTVGVSGSDAAGGVVGSLGTFSVPYIPKWRFFLFNFTKSGGNVVIRAWVDGVNVTSTSIAVTTVGQPIEIPFILIQSGNNTSVKHSFGHLAISSGQGGDDMTNQMSTALSIGNNAYTGETAIARVQRLFQEEGYTVEVVGLTGAQVGPQRTLTFLDSILEAVKADDGVLHELRGGLGYRYVTRDAMYNRSSQLTLDYTNTDLGEVPETTDDDQRTMNLFTVKRAQSGASYTARRLDGPLSTNDPTASSPGAGIYDDEKTVNLYEDAQLPDYAYWRVHLGTWDESRYPAIEIYLHRTPFAGNLRQLCAAAFLEIADVFTVINTPEWLPPEDLLLQMRAVKIFLSNFNWGIEWTALPAGPWNVAEAAGTYEAGAARFDTVESSTVDAISSSATELVVLTQESNLPWCDPLWTEDADQLDYPHESGFDLRINPQTRSGGLGGERVRVLPVYSIVDTFTRAAQLSGSVADTGQTWAASTMTAAQPTTNGSDAVFVHAAAATEAFVVLPAGFVDGVVTTLVTPSVNQATTNTLQAHVVARYVDASNYYAARLTLSIVLQLMTLDIIKVVAGVTTIVSAGTDAPVGVLTGTSVWLKFGISDRDLFAKTWRSSDSEPEWQQSVLNAASENMTGTQIGIRTLRNAGNANANSGFNFARIQMNTGAIRPYAYDYFNRTTVNGLGNAIVGTTPVAWTIYAVTAPIGAADHQVTPNQATVTIPTVLAIRGGYLNAQTLLNAQVSAIVGMPLATGGNLACVLFVRGTNVVFRLIATTTNTLQISAFDTGGALATYLATHITHAAANKYRFKVYAEGNKVGAKVWMSGDNEPDNWQLTATTVSMNSSFVGWYGQRDAGNTNVNPQMTFADFKINNPQRITVQRGMDGVSRVWDAGVDVRLWTPARLAR
jgi:hypothetical protein